jgi:hypothetical protein
MPKYWNVSQPPETRISRRYTPMNADKILKQYGGLISRLSVSIGGFM